MPPLARLARAALPAAALLFWEAAPAVSQTRSWAVGEAPLLRAASGSEPETDFFDIVSVAQLSDGTIAAADRGLSKVFLISNDGSVKASMGAPGEGPGEFARLSQVVVGDDDHLYAYDSRQQRLTEWSPDGELVGTVTLSRAASGRGVGEVGRFASGSWFAAEAPLLAAAGDGDAAQDFIGFFKLLDDGIVGDRLARVPGSYATQLTVRGQGASRNVMFSPRALHTRLGECLVTMTSDTPRVLLTAADGREVERISLSVTQRETRDADRQLWIDGVLEANQAPPEAVPVVEEMGRNLVMAGRWPIANQIIADPMGYLWMQTYEPPEGAGGGWFVVDGAGEVVAELTLPFGFAPLDVQRDRVIGIWRDELGQQEVRAYAVHRGAADARIGAGC